MKKQIIMIAVLCVILIISGCIDSTTVISVKKDGSGTITETLYFNNSVKQMMEGMMAQFGDEAEEEAEEDGINLDEYKDKAQQLGEGVKFVSAEEVTKEDGSKGTKVLYSFTDIRNLNIKAQPENPMGDGMGQMGESDESDEGGDSPITFDFIKGRNPKLIIIMPRDENGEEHAEDEAVEHDNDESDMDMAGAGLAMMKQFLGGFRLCVKVELLDGKIKDTNAAHVQNYEGRDTITLLEMEMDEMLKDEESMKKFEGLDKIKDPVVAMEKMKDMPGFKMQTLEKVEVTIK